MASVTQKIVRRRTRKERLKALKQRRFIWNFAIVTVLALLFGVPLTVYLGGAGAMYVQAIGDMPTPAESTFVGAVKGPTELYDRTGNQIILSVQDPLGDTREWVSLDELPQHVLDATLIVEDPDFLDTASSDYVGTLNDLWLNALEGPLRSNPTLTGRLVRNISNMPDVVHVDDRAREIALVNEINSQYTPEQVLEWHLNTNFYGNEAYGIEAAAQVYLGKSARELTLDEAAMLASIPTAPEFNPLDDETAARGRQSDTLRRLLVEGYITSEQHEEAIRTFTVLNPIPTYQPATAPDFANYAREQAEIILNNNGYDGGRMISRDGLQITTTLDLDAYYQAECALRAHLNRLNGDFSDVIALDGSACVTAQFVQTTPLENTQSPPNQGRVTVLDVNTGQVLALVGENTEPDFQPGMTIAPFVYFEGFREPRAGITYTPATMLLDIPQRFPGATEGLIYQPANPDGEFRGPVSLREAASGGLVPPVVQVASNQGMNNVVRTAHRLGINSLEEGFYNLSLVDYGGLVSPLDVTYAYTVLASMGNMYGVPVEPRGIGFRNRDPVAVTRIADADGNVLWEYDVNANRANVFNSFSELGYLVNDILADADARALEYGDNSVLNIGRPVAVVNTLTSDNVDNWTLGYTPYLATTVHLDRDDFAPMSLGGNGLEGAAPVWNAITTYMHQRDNLPALEWERTDNIVEGAVCQISGLLPNDVCPTRREVFINAFVPTQTDNYWQSIELNSQTRQRATANTPSALRIQETYFIPPDKAMDWWVTNKLPLPPEDYDILSRPDDDPFRTTLISQPEGLEWLRGTIEIRGAVNTTDFTSYLLRYGEGAVNPQNWFNIGALQTTPPADDLLGVWDTSTLDGVYTLELTVETGNGLRERDVVQVRIDNIPPTVILNAGDAGKIYRWPTEQIIPLSADVQDNLAINRVEFYNDGRLLFTDREAPYSYDFSIQDIGTEDFYAVAYDEAGNQNTSTLVTVEITR